MALHPAHQIERNASREIDPFKSSHLYIQAASLYARSSQPIDAERLWLQLLQDAPRDSHLWDLFYRTLLTDRSYVLLQNLLPHFSLPSLPLPSSPDLLAELLHAIHQGFLPRLDPLPFLLQAFHQSPHRFALFSQLFDELQRRQEASLIPSLFRSCLHTLLDPRQIGHTLLLRSRWFLHRDQKDDAFRDLSLALAFLPDSSSLPLQLLDFFPHFPPSHPSWLLLESLILDVRGDSLFPLQALPLLAKHHLPRAFSLAKTLLHRFPSRLDLLRLTRSFASLLGRPDDVIALLRLEIHSTDTPHAKALLLSELSDLLALESPLESVEILQQVLSILPPSPSLLSSLASRLFSLPSSWPRLHPLLFSLADLLPHERRQVLSRLFSLASQQAPPDLPVALSALQKLLPLSSDLLDLFPAFEPFFHDPEDRTILLDTLLRFEASASQPLSPSFLLLLAKTLAYHARFDEAHDRLLALASFPPPPALLPPLESLCQQIHAWKPLAAVLELQIHRLEASSSPPKPLSSLYLQLGEIFAHPLQLPDRALSCFRHALLLDPDHSLALERLKLLLAHLGHHAELCEILQQQLPRTSDRRIRGFLHLRIASLRDGYLAEPSEALDSYLQAFRLLPDPLPLLPNILRLARQLGHEEALQDVLLEQIQRLQSLLPSRPQATRAPSVVAELTVLLLALAESYDRQDNLLQALETYKRLHDLNPTHPAPLRWLAEYFARNQQWEKAFLYIAPLLENPSLPPEERSRFQLLLSSLDHPSPSSLLPPPPSPLLPSPPSEPSLTSPGSSFASHPPSSPPPASSTQPDLPASPPSPASPLSPASPPPPRPSLSASFSSLSGSFLRAPHSLFPEGSQDSPSLGEVEEIMDSILPIPPDLRTPASLDSLPYPLPLPLRHEALSQISSLARLSDASSSPPEHLQTIAELYLALDQPPMALSTLRLGLKLHPEHPRLLALAAPLLSSSSDIDLLLAAFLHQPSDPTPLQRLGRLFFHSREASGLALVSSLLSFFPSSPPLPLLPFPSSPPLPLTPSEISSLLSPPPDALVTFQFLQDLAPFLSPSSPPPSLPPPLPSHHPLAALSSQIARSLGLPAPEIFEDSSFSSLSLLATSPRPCLLLPPSFFHDLDPAHQTFSLALSLASLLPPFCCLPLLPSSLAPLLDSLPREIFPPPSVPSSLWKTAEKLCPPSKRPLLLSSSRWLQLHSLLLSRIAFLLSSRIEPLLQEIALLDPKTAPFFPSDLPSLLQHSPPLRSFLSFAFSDSHFSLRQKLQIPLCPPPPSDPLSIPL